MSSFVQRLRGLGRRPASGEANPVLEGPVTRTLLGLSIPMIMAMFLVTGFGLVDMIYLGRFSKEAMAAVGLAFPLTYLLHTFGGALGTGATSVCSRLIGRNEDRQVRNLVWHTILLAVALSAVLVPASLLVLKPSLSGADAEPTVVAMAVEYGTIYLLGGILSLVAFALNALIRGEGDTIFPFKVMAIGLVLNIVLDPLFIFGPGPFPRLGVRGAAVTTLIAYGASTLLVFRALRDRDRKVRWDRRAWSWDPRLMRDLVGVAGPASVANLALPISVYLINRMLAPEGTAALAAFGAGLRLLSFVFLPTLGLSLSMMIMIGQNHGAGKRRRVARITLVTLGYALSLLAILAVPVILFPRWALGLFTDDPAVIAAGWPLARWVTVARPMLSVVNITALWFQARGMGLAGMLPNTLQRVFLEPVGVWVGLHLLDQGLSGAWYGMAAGGFVGGGACLFLLLWRLRVYVRDEALPETV